MAHIDLVACTAQEGRGYSYGERATMPPEGYGAGQPYSEQAPREGYYPGQEGQGYDQPGYGGQGGYAGGPGRREGEGLVERLEDDFVGRQ